MSQRTDLAKRLPWVTRLTKPQPCKSLRWGDIPLKAIYGDQPTGTEKYKCRNVAYWQFKASKRSQATSGVYCWQHLIYQCLYGDMVEANRLKRWFDKNDPSN